MLKRQLRHPRSRGFIRIKLNSNPPLKPNLFQSPKNGRKINNPFPRRQMLMNAISPNILQMHMDNLIRHRFDDHSRVLPYAK